MPWGASRNTGRPGCPAERAKRANRRHRAEGSLVHHRAEPDPSHQPSEGAPVSGHLIAVDLPGGPAFVDALRDGWDGGDAVLPVDQRLPHAAKAALLATM